MVSRVDVSVRDSADLLGINPVVVARLCRYLHIDCREQRIPFDVVERAGHLETSEERYAALRTWMLQHWVAAHNELPAPTGWKDPDRRGRGLRHTGEE